MAGSVLARPAQGGFEGLLLAQLACHSARASDPRGGGRGTWLRCCPALAPVSNCSCCSGSGCCTGSGCCSGCGCGCGSGSGSGSSSGSSCAAPAPAGCRGLEQPPPQRVARASQGAQEGAVALGRGRERAEMGRARVGVPPGERRLRATHVERVGAATGRLRGWGGRWEGGWGSCARCCGSSPCSRRLRCVSCTCQVRLGACSDRYSTCVPCAATPRLCAQRLLDFILPRLDTRKYL